MAKILVVDDMEVNRLILYEILHRDYEIAQAENGILAIDYLFNVKELPDLVLLDIMMPEMDGFEVIEIMRTNERTARIPVIFITAADPNENETKGLKYGAVDYISKPFNPDVVKVRVDNQVELYAYRTSLEGLVEKKAAELMETRERILETMAAMIEYRNLESGQHVQRTCQFTKVLIENLMLKSKHYDTLVKLDYNTIIKSTALHDIGKIGIPDNILLKPGALTSEEFEIVKTHTTIGSDIIDSLLTKENVLYLRHCRDICRSHHEYWNGKGYPDGLSGTDIPFSARILAIADVYDALVSSRVYKPPFSHNEARDIIAGNRGIQFDPDVVDAFLEVEEKFRTLTVSGNG